MAGLPEMKRKSSAPGGKALGVSAGEGVACGGLAPQGRHALCKGAGDTGEVFNGVVGTDRGDGKVKQAKGKVLVYGEVEYNENT